MCLSNVSAAPQVPEFRVSYTITTDKFDALYKKLKPKGVTLTALLAKAAGVALAKHPLLYACVSLKSPSLRIIACKFGRGHFARFMSECMQPFLSVQRKGPGFIEA